ASSTTSRERWMLTTIVGNWITARPSRAPRSAPCPGSRRGRNRRRESSQAVPSKVCGQASADPCEEHQRDDQRRDQQVLRVGAQPRLERRDHRGPPFEPTTAGLVLGTASGGGGEVSLRRGVVCSRCHFANSVSLKSARAAISRGSRLQYATTNWIAASTSPNSSINSRRRSEPSQCAVSPCAPMSLPQTCSTSPHSSTS